MDEYIEITEIDKYGNKSITLNTIPMNEVLSKVAIHGAGGGDDDDPDPPRTPVESANSLFATSVVEVVDLLCEGEIEGPATSNLSWVYLDGTQVQGTNGVDNFQGVEIDHRVGEPHTTQPAVPIPTAGASVVNNREVTKSTFISSTITDLDIDHVIITLSFPNMSHTRTDGDHQGDIVPTGVDLYLRINGQDAGNINVYGKCTSEYRRDHIIRDIGIHYGAGPWTIQVWRQSPDSSSSYLNNRSFWHGHTTIKEINLSYADSAIAHIKVDAKQFGNKIPTRGYHLKGLKIKVPTNYDVAIRQYTGAWDGTFKTEYCNNPAWVYYDILTNKRYGLGLDAEYVDKWELYAVGVYCDGSVEDGFGAWEPRFVYNGALRNREEANHALNSMASTFRGMPYWSSGFATVSADRPQDPTRLITASNIKNGEFSYESSDLKQRYTAVNITWNDPDDYYRASIEVVDYPEGVDRYGWNSIDIVAVGCTSRGQAKRFGKWFLYTNYYETELISFTGGWDIADMTPGEIVLIQDEYQANKEFSGRLKSGTTSSGIVLDKPVTLELGETYEAYVVLPDGSVENKDVTDSNGTYTTLNLNGSFTDTPKAHSIWILSASNVAPRHFRVLSVKETSINEFEVGAIEHDPNKYQMVEDNIYFDEPPYTDIPEGTVTPPTNLTLEEYLYKQDLQWQTGVLMSWTHSTDPRSIRYDAQWRSTVSGAGQPTTWTHLDSVDVGAEPSIVHSPVVSGNKDYRVRTVGSTGYSTWLEGSIDVFANPDAPPDVTGLQVVGGGTTFDGFDCEFEWDAVSSNTISGSLVKDYYIEFRTPSNALLRTAVTTDTNYIYTYNMNQEDHSGTAARSFIVKVWARNIYLKKSIGCAQQTFSNPLVTMAGLTPTTTAMFQCLKVDWSNIVPADNDLEKFKVYLDKNNPPTTEVGEVSRNTTYWYEHELEPETTYFVQIEPWDGFGVGTKSNVANEEPLKLAQESIEGELVDRLVITDSLGTVSGTIEKLYDGNKISDGISYTDMDWVDYEFPVEQLQDRVQFWCESPVGVYISLVDTANNRVFLSGESDHTLDNEGRLVTYSGSEVEARVNYWWADAGNGVINNALFPNRLVSKDMRIHFVGPTDVFELRFVDQVIAEQIIANELAAISADLGVITAGTIQSNNWGSTEGMLYDLGNEVVKFGGATDPKLHWDDSTDTLKIRASVTFETTSSGYDNIDDRPTCLSGINDAEGNSLGIVAGWGHTSDKTLIDGGNLYTDTIVANKIVGGEITGFGYDYRGSGTWVVPTTSGTIASAGLVHRGGPATVYISHDIKRPVLPGAPGDWTSVVEKWKLTTSGFEYVKNVETLDRQTYDVDTWYHRSFSYLDEPPSYWDLDDTYTALYKWIMCAENANSWIYGSPTITVVEYKR